MRAARLILIAVAAGTFVPEAHAVNYVWWEATPGNAESSVINMGLGQNLELECAENAARCEWDVTMFLANDEIWYWWGQDLIPNEPTLHVTGFQYETWFSPGPGYFYPFEEVSQITTINGGVHDAGAFTLGDGAVPYAQSYYGVPYALFSFTLAKLKGASWTPGLSEITTFNSPWLWGPPGPPELWVQFGANPAINAVSFGGTPAGPVITVLNVPEPATAALVGVAVVCLAWRGRRRVS